MELEIYIHLLLNPYKEIMLNFVSGIKIVLWTHGPCINKNYAI